MKENLMHIIRRGGGSLLLLVALLLSFVACTDNTGEDDTSPEFTTNWKQRNAEFFDSVLTVARQEVAQAQAQYGDLWQSHCPWRVFLSYSKVAGGVSTDSICAYVKQSGTATDVPYYTDSIKVNYMGRLMPTASYKDGRVFDHSGTYELESYVFSDRFSTPSHFAVSNLVEGYTTAVMHMHVGDRWMVYIPQELGYGSASQGVLPAYSTLCFDMQLKGLARKGYTLN